MRVLFVTLHNILGEINNGGNQCTERNLKLLRRIYHEENVDLCVAMEEIPNYQDRQEVYTIPLMKSRSVEFIAGLMLHIDFTQSAEERVCELVRKNKYDMVFFDNTKFGRIIRKLKKDKTIPGKIVVFAHNVEKDILWQRVVNENKLCLPLYVAGKYCERLALKYSDIFLALSRRDGDMFGRVYGREPDYILPITFTDKHQKECEMLLPKRSLLFTGSDYPPNVKGIRWFCREVMPYLDIPLYIVGRGLEKLRDELGNEKVKVIGSVESLTAYLQSAGAVVMPIFYGSGMKVKTAEAIMHGKRIFATIEALAGYEIAEYGMTCCNDAESFVKAILHYFEEEKIQREIREVRQVFLQYYDTDNYEKSLADVLERNDG